MKDLPRIGIFCEASAETGLGHAMRCLSLADGLMAAGCEVHFILPPGSQKTLFDAKGFQVRMGSEAQSIDRGSADCILPLLSQQNTDMLIIDSYRLSASFFSQLARARPELPVMIFDDAGEHALFDVFGMISPGLAAKPDDYPGRVVPYSAVGPEYCLPSDACLSTAPREPDTNPNRILVVMGGSDPEGQTMRVAEVLAPLQRGWDVEVVAGPLYEGVEELRRFVKGKANISLHHDPEDFHELACSCGLAITAGGLTAMELLVLGVPVAVLSLAHNQDPTAGAVESLGIGANLGRFDQLSDVQLAQAIKAVMDNHERREARAREAVRLINADGRHRLAEKVIYSWKAFHGMAFDLDEVCREYLEASGNEKSYRQALWGSHEGMVNRFRLGFEALGERTQGRWLDVGCGPGDVLPEAEGMGFVFESYTGTDLCPNTLAEARHVEALTSSRVYLKQDFLAPIQGEPFDLVTCFGVLHKCGHALSVSVERLASLCAPGGALVMTTKNLDWDAFDEPGFIPYEKHAWFRMARLRQVVEQSGFTIEVFTGFEPREGVLRDTGKSHSVLIKARKPRL